VLYLSSLWFMLHALPFLSSLIWSS
jgi:hypothetical protein